MMIVFELDRRFAIDMVVTELSPKPADVIPILTKTPAEKALTSAQGLNGRSSVKTPEC